MSDTNYTEIPDTSDNNYWEVTQNAENRSTTFVPKEKELHQQLRKKEWALIQAGLTKKNGKWSTFHTNADDSPIKFSRMIACRLDRYLLIYSVLG